MIALVQLRRLWLPLLLALAARIAAQPVAYNHPDLEWHSSELAHCTIHVHEGLEDLGLVAAQIMEEIWDPITSLYGYEPDTRVHLIFYDTDDYSNGGAYFYNNKIIIWATSLDFDLRGQHNWLRNVLTHEFTHIVQLGAARKFSRQMPFLYFQMMGYEPEKRDDVVQGFPNRVASYPLAGTMVPAWFAEGTAQRMVEGHRYDFWDSHRDMVLRDRVLHGALFDLDEMASFDKNSVGGESVYNQGFSLVNWIAERHGDESLRRLSEELARPHRLSMATAMERVLGVDGHELWRRWKADLEEDYARQLAGVDGRGVEGRLVSTSRVVSQAGGGRDEHREELRTPPTSLAPHLPAGSCCAGLGAVCAFPEAADELGPTNNINPRVSPDGRHVYYASNGDADWLGMTDLWRYDRQAGTCEKVLPNIRGPFALSPDGASVIFSRTSPVDKLGRHYRDLYQYWFEEKVTRRLTEGARLSQPDLAPDGRRLVAVQNGGGSTWPVLFELDSLDGPAWQALSKRQRKAAPRLQARRLGQEPYGSQFFQPRWDPRGTRIVAARAWGHGRDLVELDPATGATRELLATQLDERQATFSADGRWLVYAQDEGGIFNIWRLDLEEGRRERLTAVTGGAFMPTLAGDTLYYSGYRDQGFRLFELAPLHDQQDAPAALRPHYAEAIPPLGTADQDPAPRTWQPLRTEFEKPFWIPRLVVDDGELKPGLFFLNMDVFEKVELSGGVAAARLTNMDLFASASAALGKGAVFTELYGMTRDHDERFDDPFVIVGETPDGAPRFDQYGVRYRFSLAEGHLGWRRRLSDVLSVEGAVSLANYKASYKRPPLTVNYDYYKGTGLRLRFDHQLEAGRRVDDFINPRGRRWASLELRQHWDRLIDGFEVSSAGLLEEVYTPATFLEGELALGRSWALPFWPALSLTVDGKAALIGDAEVDDFFHTYAGGLMGLRGYSYYSLGGVRKALGHVRLGFPIIRRVGWPLGPWHVKRLYGSLNAGAGDAWGGRGPAFDLKREVGGDLKLFLTSWAMLPTALTVGAAYGLDEFRVPALDPGEFYGREWRWYATLLFEFDVFQERIP
ncbi:MAG: hypothetical protein Q8O14_10075 [bacterium]|jgi:hypothetical protein|nr:hypothetical protein [bacterium]